MASACDSCDGRGDTDLVRGGVAGKRNSTCGDCCGSGTQRARASRDRCRATDPEARSTRCASGTSPVKVEYKSSTCITQTTACSPQVHPSAISADYTATYDTVHDGRNGGSISPVEKKDTWRRAERHQSGQPACTA